ncbi:hypothetical protein PCANC_11408 [Puccinia coronata f. sp. avenae]|uniref:Heparan-alpha-glucosaminide N-acetyltransferase catalytic domain-containing protein n=1 Tax=Puccinia coronata f. sp. avenae TaxID=200324 RepID=A0A2N5VML8_9BASI|nr:hypothetical protein PCASD_23212 [Puccinia coronata f. sp. avenae]PLW34954.1 hypothetical protein PCASD_14246 [Puccinia coronata f. sp. avenae]PLW51206.1 hypothetical protein PCANC_11408 [Puccinia coronata f. sp. avenae]
METSEKPTQKRTLTTADPHDRTRDRSVDVLRGLTCFAMILVNTAAPIHPGWLAHPGDMRDPITFADTLFPCFLFTSGLASTHSRSSTHPVGRNEGYARIKRTCIRALKLSLIGIAYHNLIPRLTGFHPHSILDFSTYRFPSVLGRIGISSVVCALEPCLDIPPPILPGILALVWHVIAGLRPLTPLHHSSQAWLDRVVFGTAHLHQPDPGFDPEGLLASLLTVPISALLGTYLAAPLRRMHSVSLINPLGITQLLALGILGSSLTGLLPSPASKLLWTPTYVAQTAATSVLYWSFSTALVSFDIPLTRPLISALQILGQRSLEIYLISASASFSLQKFGSWDALAHLITRLLISTGLANHHHQRDLAVGVARSSLLGLAMIPVAKCLMHFGWKI